MFTSQRYQIASQVFKTNLYCRSHDHTRTRVSYVFLCAFFAVLIAESIFLYLFGDSIGSEKLLLWLLSLGLALAIEFLLMKPVLILIRSIFLPALIFQDVHQIVKGLLKRARLILLRTSGILRNANCSIQHVSVPI